MDNSSIIKTWWGNFTKPELKKFSLLGGIFSFTIGVYWLLRPIKDGVFNQYVGAQYIPTAKLVSLVVVIPLVIIYSKLVDMFPRQRVFYALSIIYALLALGLGLIMLHPELGIHMAVSKAGHPTIWGRLVGWFAYSYVESFGSIMVALFWAFAADTTTPEAAKRGYAIVAFGAQLGGILGPLVAATQAEKVGVPTLLMIASVVMLCIGAMVWFFMSVTPKEELAGYQAAGAHSKPKEKTSFFSDMKLLFSQPYLLGIFAVITLYEVIVTIFDFYLKYFASLEFNGAGEYTSYMGVYGVYTNIVACVCVFLGVNNIGRKLGLAVALVITPIIIAVASLVLAFSPTLSVAFWIMVFCKGLNYALNQPSKEQLYIPTTPETKYKVKAFMEMFGSRSSKAFGSVVNMVKQFVTSETFILFSTIASLGMVGVWLYTALYLAKTHKQAIAEKRVVC
jgi:ATP:ADP antiporter, AAA family